MRRGLRVIVSSVFSRTRYAELPGDRDARMAFAVGFRALGHDVFVVEEVEEGQCLDSSGQIVPFDEWRGRDRFLATMREYGFADRCCLDYRGGQATVGMSRHALRGAASGADLLLAVGGRLRNPELLEAAGHRAYVDINPGKTQVYAFEYDVDYGLSAFDSHFSVGLAIGQPQCPLPTGGFQWHPLVMPVVLDRWRPNAASGRAFTSITSWNRKHDFDFQGVASGDKVEQWLRFVDLPNRTGQSMEIVLPVREISARDLGLLTASGWLVRNGERQETLNDYVQLLSSSKAEFSVANGRYVKFRTGWFSDRTSRYMATGRPVLVQSTGIEHLLPVGRGLLTFRTIEEAVSGIDEINSDHAGHSSAALEIAREFSASDRVLAGLLRIVGLS